MRIRFVVRACLLAMLVAAVAATTASAAPRHNRYVTITATPEPILAGQAVVIYGQVVGGKVGDVPIVLYQHLKGSGGGWSPIARTTTDAEGFYVFPSTEQAVYTNRTWFVREAVRGGLRSRFFYEQVHALVSLSPSSVTTDTGSPVLFTGTVSPNHTGERVVLQTQAGNNGTWSTIKKAVLGPGSNYAITYTWRTPGPREVRVLFPTDEEDFQGASSPSTVTIEQAQVPGFTIASSSPVINYGQSATISGVLDQSGTTKPDPNIPVTLWARNAYQTRPTPIADTTTSKDGSYSFSPAEVPGYNTIYQVRTTLAPHRSSAVLFEGVREVLSMSASPTTATVGQKVTFSGTVLPDQAGHVIYLQRLGADGQWHSVETGYVRYDSTFEFESVVSQSGTYRARIIGNKANIGSASAPVAITVTLPPVTALPPAPLNR